jgi:hypothetical protein
MLALAFSVTACSSTGPLTVTGAPTPSAGGAASCRALLAALPGSLGTGLGRRAVSPPGVSAAAWGRGPVLLTCGAKGTAPGYTQSSQVEEIESVDWYPEQTSTGSRWSTPTRQPQVVVLIPADVPPADVLVEIAPAIRATTRALVAPLPAPS